MIRSIFAAVAVAAGLWAFGAVATAEDKKETKLTGTLVCGSCKLNESKKCANVLQVKEKDKVINYWLTDKASDEAYHEKICGGGELKVAHYNGHDYVYVSAGDATCTGYHPHGIWIDGAHQATFQVLRCPSDPSHWFSNLV